VAEIQFDHEIFQCCLGETMYLKQVFCILLAGFAVAFFLVKVCLAESVGNESLRIVQSQHPVLALPGGLDSSVQVFNSNSPEVVKTDGILLSTFSAQDKQHPDAHLNYPLRGRVDFFLHHINNRIGFGDTQTVNLGLLIQNASDSKATVRILTGATYLSQPDAPFISLPPLVPNDNGSVFAGPGDRVMNDVLRGRREEALLPEKIELAPHQYALLLNCPIPVLGLDPPINGRSALIQLESDQPLYAASMSKILPAATPAPALSEWIDLLQASDRAGQKEKAASPPGAPGPFIYGRVAGVQTGSTWSAKITNTEDKQRYVLRPGETCSFVLDTVERGTYGTKQIQAAPLAVRYPDTAFSAHGNYGVHYHIDLPFLFNSTSASEDVSVTLDSPIKDDQATNSLQYYDGTSKRVFFRGTVEVSSEKAEPPNTANVNYSHLVLHQGEEGKPIFQARFNPGETGNVRIDFFYPPDATPAQVLTIKAEKAP
jgi:hypothetical protein